MFMFYIARLISFVGLLAFAASLPLSGREAQEPWTPTVLYPNKSTRWCVGARHNVHWDPSHPPAVVSRYTADLYLVKDGLIDEKHPLATEFPLAAGEVAITVPNVSPGKYCLNLFGDSGNLSDPFEIDYC